MDKVMAEMFGKVTGSSRGRGGSMHIFDVEKAILWRQCHCCWSPTISGWFSFSQ
nr:hypothetical protein [uncultured Paraglaciecola sp.]